MNVFLYNLDFEKEFEVEDYAILEIDNQILFKKILSNIMGYLHEVNDIGIFEKNKKLEKDKDYTVIIDYFNYEFYSKTAITKLYKNMEQHYNNDLTISQKINSISNKISDFIKNINLDYDIDFSYENQFSLESILKFVSLKPSLSEEINFNDVINYISFIASLKLYKLIIFINLQAFFTENEILEILKIASYKDIKIIVLENKFYFNSLNKKIQIDEDYFVKNNSLQE